MARATRGGRRIDRGCVPCSPPYARPLAVTGAQVAIPSARRQCAVNTVVRRGARVYAGRIRSMPRAAQSVRFGVRYAWRRMVGSRSLVTTRRHEVRGCRSAQTTCAVVYGVLATQSWGFVTRQVLGPLGMLPTRDFRFTILTRGRYIKRTLL